MPRVTKGVFSGVEPLEFSDDERARLCACLGGQITPKALEQARSLRHAYCTIVSMQEQMATMAEVDALRLKWVRLVQSVEQVALSAGRGGEHNRADRALRQVLGAEYGAAVGQLVDAAWRLRPIVEKKLDDKANIRDVRKGEAAGLRTVLWFLHEPVEGGVRRGESLGLAMGSGVGRGAPSLLGFLSVITSREISGDDVRNAIDFMTKHDRMPKRGNKPSGFDATLTEFPDIW